jgi:hypothetical protein
VARTNTTTSAEDGCCRRDRLFDITFLVGIGELGTASKAAGFAKYGKPRSGPVDGDDRAVVSFHGEAVGSD